MSGNYPFDIPEDDPRSGRSGQSRPVRESFATLLAIAASDVVYDLSEWRLRHGDLSRLVVGIALLLLGFASGAGGAITDEYLHRGVESGAEQPYIVQPTGKVLSTNVDLRNRSAEDIKPVADALASGGFHIVRQQFRWADIEQSRGAYSWDEYDLIVSGLSRQHIGVIAVIVDTPDWARSIGEGGFDDAPPRNPEVLKGFTAALTSHYKDTVPFVQIGDHPNISSHWGGVPATGEVFTPYLQAGWEGARSGYAGVRVLSPELALHSDQEQGPTDLQFVDQLYNAGAKPYFDVLAMRLDGATFSPDDRRVSANRSNVSRAILFREAMVAHDDAQKPVWATSFGWAIGDQVTPDEQAEFVERGLERSWSEWPWMGPMIQWSFLEVPDSPNFGYAILRNGAPTPLWIRLTSPVIAKRSDVANTGFAPMDAPSIDDSGNWQNQHLQGRTFRTTKQVGATMTISFQGTGLIAYVRSGPVVGTFTVHVDGKLISGGGGKSGNDWDLSFFSTTDDFPRTIVRGLKDGQHTMTIRLVGPGELTLGGVEVTREAPFVWPIILVTAGSLICLFFGMRSIAYLLATRAGLIRRESDPDPGPQLPQMPNWRPERRIS